jgi:hypothetical protein
MMGYFEITHELLVQLMQGLLHGDRPRKFTVIQDAIPDNARIVRTEVIGDTTRVYFSNGDNRQYTPTLKASYD